MAVAKLYDLAGAQADRRFSPYCWRTRLALAHKGLAVETIPWRFAEKDAIARSGQGKVPVLVEGDAWIADSWKIAEYLEATYPERPSLFGGGAGRALSWFYSTYGDSLVAKVFGLVVMDVFEHLDEGDKAYFRTSREARVGMTLEEFAAGRDARAPALREHLTPLRQVLADQPFLGGDAPLYADYAVFGPFQWARCISPYPVLDPGDPVAAWRDRILDAFGGLARNTPAYAA